MRTTVKVFTPAAILAAGLLVNTSASFGKPEYTRRTNKECDFCHPPHSRELNDAGKYYLDHKHSLAGYKPSTPPAPAKPGSGGKQD